MKLIKQAWLRENNLSDDGLPIYELYVIGQIVFAILLGFITSLLTKKLELILLPFIAYIFVGYQLPLFVRLIKEAPNTYRVGIIPYFKYQLLILFRTNSLFPFTTSFTIVLMIFSQNGILLALCYVSVEVTLFGILTLKMSHRKIASALAYGISGGLILLGGIMFLKHYDSHKVVMILVLSLMISLITLCIMQNESRLIYKYVNWEIKSRHNIVLDFLLGLVKYSWSQFILYILIVFFYLYISKTYSIELSIMPLFPFLILFEGIMNSQYILHSSKNNLGRILFLAPGKLTLTKLILGNVFYKIFPLLAIMVPLGVFEVVKVDTSLIQVILVYLWSTFLLYYFSRVEISIALGKKNRPNFFEQYFALIINILLVLI
ncbi:hypothetical protein [Weissella minor]|uniref:hypothetical protein n=1 Tax=Weissella minor TaxID=1620 RepID=UPI003AF1E804